MFIVINTSIHSLPQNIVDKQADEIAAFVSNLEINKLRFQECTIYFEPRGFFIIYDYKLDNGKYTLIKKR
jgi:hypothetical protein